MGCEPCGIGGRAHPRVANSARSPPRAELAQKCAAVRCRALPCADYVRSSKKGLVGGEVELPAPPQASDLNESSRVVITRSTIDPAAESAMPPEDAPDAARV
jgi:hypothetical protein